MDPETGRPRRGGAFLHTERATGLEPATFSLEGLPTATDRRAAHRRAAESRQWTAVSSG